MSELSRVVLVDALHMVRCSERLSEDARARLGGKLQRLLDGLCGQPEACAWRAGQCVCRRLAEELFTGEPPVRPSEDCEGTAAGASAPQ